ncbi:hypothetical protein EDD71_1129 [Fonticella tunisiensis]|uniref:Uncharacterized protein n=1 Tax=Fonticella tunisiensis TaxID=1096341 RepID=A0A4R7KL09_9CLOT|nr:hypothetical protein EDD71_1129 [Fonticella tunisiensis]
MPACILEMSNSFISSNHLLGSAILIRKDAEFIHLNIDIFSNSPLYPILLSCLCRAFQDFQSFIFFILSLLRIHPMMSLNRCRLCPCLRVVFLFIRRQGFFQPICSSNMLGVHKRHYDLQIIVPLVSLHL